MGTQVANGILVRGRPVSTGLRVNAFDRLEISASGRVNFGGLTGSFLSTAVLTADGDNWPTPSDFPAPRLAKNSLVVEVRTRGGYDGNQRWNRFYQGGVRREVVPGDPGEVFLLANDATPDDNADGWVVNVRRIFPDPVTPMLAVDRIELVQGIQRPDNSVPLVTGKPTVVRVYPTDGSARIDRVTGRCEVRFLNGTREWAPLIRSRGSAEFITARPRGAHFRDDPTSSLNFLVRSSPSPSSRGRT